MAYHGRDSEHVRRSTITVSLLTGRENVCSVMFEGSEVVLHMPRSVTGELVNKLIIDLLSSERFAAMAMLEE